MDKIQKALRRLNAKERKEFAALLQMIESGRIDHLDVKRLSGHSEIYRVRKGSYRVIFRRAKNGAIFILAFERRSDTTYNSF